MIGWQNFIEGFWSKQFVQCQDMYHTRIKSRKSAILLMVKVQRKIWHIAWTLWTSRNSHLHVTRQSIHPQQEVHLIDEIKYELDKGIEDLPQVYQTRFRHTIEEIDRKSLQYKVNWLFGIWTARESRNPIYLSLPSLPAPNTTLRLKYVQWKESIL